ncbi:MAG: cyclic nucleotide-binding domain-containing protein [Planctomyces sp.]|nr:cyclic nucleotide-binding domain-containing protein [Planctomyces sp.]
MIHQQPNILKMLSESRFTENLNNQQLQSLCRASRVHSLPAGTILFQEGELEDEVFVISSGHVRLSMSVPGRGNVVLLTSGPGDLVGWSGLISDGRMTATAVAADDCVLVALSGKRVRELCETDPQLGYVLMIRLARVLSQRILATRLQLLDLFRPGGDSR